MMNSRAFLQELDTIPDIPTLPVVAVKVNKMIQDEDVSLRKLSRIIENDQAFVIRVLRLVNSSFYHFQSRIDTIRRAIVVLNLKTIANAVLSVSIMETFQPKEKLQGFDITEFWNHSICVAVTSKYLGEETRLESPDECFVAGLVHDIGKVVLAAHFEGLFREILARIRDENLSFCEAEKTVLPVSHAQIGEYLAKKWRLPSGLADAIGYHHGVSRYASNFNLLMIVHVADIIANACMLDPRSSLDHLGIHPDAARTMAHWLETVPEWFPAIRGEIESTCRFLLEDSHTTKPL